MSALRLCTLVMLSGVALLTGCAHKVVVAAVQPLPPPVMTSVPPRSHVFEPEPKIALAEDADVTLLIPSPRVPPRRRPAPVAPAPIEAAVAPPPPMDLGNLTIGGESTSNAVRQQTDDLLQTQHKRLTGVPANIASSHSQQMDQVRLFLRQADEAWQKQDLEGARTLATKAKVLLDEVYS